MIIGLAGYARSGKDAAAEIMVNEFGFTRVAFADKLREVLYALNPLLEYQGVLDRHAMKRNYLQEVIDEYGWDGYKETGFSNEIRRLLQRLGTEAGRNILGETIWVDTTMNNLPEGHVVVTDVRFPNEASAVKSKGEVWRVIRKDVGPANDHPSETALDNWSGYTRFLHNKSSLEDYQDSIRKAIAQTIKL